MNAESLIGIVTKFFPERRFGFVEIPGHQDDVFFHMKGGHKACYEQATDTVQIKYHKPERDPIVGDRLNIRSIERRGKGMEAQWLLAESFERALMLRELLVPVSKNGPKKPLTLDLARALLSHCDRHVLEDQTFGDSEITWLFKDREIAGGYFGDGSSVTVGATALYEADSFEDEDSMSLRHVCQRTHYSRNDGEY